MIFSPYLTVEAEQERVNANKHWGGVFTCLYNGDMSQQSLNAFYDSRRQSLVNYACVSLDEAAQTYGFNAEQYVEQAAKRKAILFTLHNGEHMVPIWALHLDKDDKFVAINDLAVEVAEIYTKSRPTGEAHSFCNFMASKKVGMSPECLYSEIYPGQRLSQDFHPRAYEKLLMQTQTKAMFRSLMFASSMAYGDNAEYVSECMHKIVPYLLAPTHTKPDNIEFVIDTMIPVLRTSANTSRQRLSA